MISGILAITNDETIVKIPIKKGFEKKKKKKK